MIIMKKDNSEKLLWILLILKIFIYISLVLDYDLYNRCIWVWKLQDVKIFDIYNNGTNFTDKNGNIDYPPLYPIYEWVLSHIHKWDIVNLIDMYSTNKIQLLWLQKVPAFIADILFSIKVIRDKNIYRSYIWILLPINIMFGAIFGLSDIIIGICIWLFIEYANDKKYTNMIVVTVLCCLVKQQGLYLVIAGIVFILHEKIDITHKIRYIFEGIILTYMCWIPFVINNKDIFLPLKFYTIVLDRWHSLSKGAPNIWTIIQIINVILNANIERYSINIFLILLSIVVAYIIFIKLKNIALFISVLTLNIAVICQNQISRYFYYFVIALMLYESRNEIDKVVCKIIMWITIINTFIQWYNEMLQGKLSSISFGINVISSIIVIYITVIFYMNQYKKIKDCNKKLSSI